MHRPAAPTAVRKSHAYDFLLLQIYSLNIEFYQLQATNTKTGRPAQWALATWAPEGPVSSA